MALVQIEESLLLEILNRANYLTSVMQSLYERVRNREASDWLTLEDLCGLLNISATKARTLKAIGKIGFVKCRKKCLYHAGDAWELLERVDRRKNNE